MRKTNSMGLILILPVLIFLATAGVANAQGAYDNVNRPGKDYKSFLVDEDNWYECMSGCLKDIKCSAWTYVKPGFQGPKGRCYLKNEIPKGVSNKCCWSGYVCHKLAFATTSPLPSAVIGGDYSYQIKMSSGVRPYKFYPMRVPPEGSPPRRDTSRDQRFSMPPGLKLSRSGLISGQVQPGAAGYIPIMIMVRGSCPDAIQEMTKKFYINITPQP